MWLADYIVHYKAVMDATAEDTRTKPYNRLLDLLKKDYDMVAARYADRYKKEEHGTDSYNEPSIADMNKVFDSYLNRISNTRNHKGK